MQIERSKGLPITVGGLPTPYTAGGGYRGATSELDETVQQAAEVLADAYSMAVTIRFNSDRRSGGAWLKTHDVDGFGANAEIGIGARLRDDRAVVTAYIGRNSLISPAYANTSGYYWGTHESIADALSFVQTHGSLDA